LKKINNFVHIIPDSHLFLFALYYNNLVERFELIATTGKNAKPRIIRFPINQTSHLVFILISTYS